MNTAKPAERGHPPGAGQPGRTLLVGGLERRGWGFGTEGQALMDCAEAEATSTRAGGQVSRDQVESAAAGSRQGTRRPWKATSRRPCRWPDAAQAGSEGPLQQNRITSKDQQTDCDQKGIKAVKTNSRNTFRFIWPPAGSCHF